LRNEGLIRANQRATLRDEGLIRVNRGEYKNLEYFAVVLCAQRNVHVGNNLKSTGKKIQKHFF